MLSIAKAVSQQTMANILILNDKVLAIISFEIKRLFFWLFIAVSVYNLPAFVCL